jgi:hypothetical protein
VGDTTELPTMDAEPAHDTKTGEVAEKPSAEERTARLAAAYQHIKKSNPEFDGHKWRDLVREATGKVSYDEMDWADLIAIDESATQLVARTGS